MTLSKPAASDPKVNTKDTKMSFLNPLTWDFDFFLLRSGNDATTQRRRRERITLLGVYISTIALSTLWLSLVSTYVPDPYLDEIFHIPQAQAYCKGDFSVWDPKLTTPPGLYIFSTLLIKFIRGGTCSALELRATNTFTLLTLFPTVYSCRKLINRKPVEKDDDKNDAEDLLINWDAIHTAVNICLFPLIFFFSGLYYTDVLSTFIVIKSYEHFLQERDKQPGLISSGLSTFLIGVVALLMRQTNIFWIAVFMGGLELTRTFHALRWFLLDIPKDSQEVRSNTSSVISLHRKYYDPMQGQLNAVIMAAYNGAFYDPKLEDAGALDFFWCVASLAAATISNPIPVASRLWPYISLLLSFAMFVFWNGGVVLGDKSNHVATIHLPQMLYIWPFMAFFSLPLLISSIVQFFFTSRWSFHEAEINSPIRTARLQLSTVGWPLVGTVLAIGVIHFNTIIHPFTLADNRHYVFYVFRYTVRRHWIVKYVFGPIYIMSAYFIFHTLAGSCLPNLNMIMRKDQDPSVTALKKGQSGQSTSYSTSSLPSTSFTLIWLISTALSLITAPLVEPRYFIIPWVIWRLHVPTLPFTFDVEQTLKKDGVMIEKGAEISIFWRAKWIKYWAYQGHDYRLWLETIWFLLISLVTGYIFLFKGFEWSQEPGKVQRFMW